MILAYWESRYARGGNSGAGSIGKYRAWKWKIIDRWVPELDDVLDVGCGDLSFWQGRDCARYLGLDGSPSVLARDRVQRPGWRFIERDISSRGVRIAPHEVVLCLDVLFHILEDCEYEAALRHLQEWTHRWLFVCTWTRDPLRRPDEYQVFRDFRKDLPAFEEAGFTLMAIHKRRPYSLYVLNKRWIV